MSNKISQDKLKELVSVMLSDDKRTKERKFVESIDFQVNLRDYNPEKEKRFDSNTVLNHACRTKVSFCIIGSVKHIDEAKEKKYDHIDIDGLKKFNNEAKAIKKFARKYDVLLVSESLSRQVTKLVGRHLSSVRKLPQPIPDNDKVADKYSNLLKTIKFRVKKYPWLAQSIGTVKLTPEQILENLNKSLNFLVSLLPKGWQNLKSVTIKSTMGKPVKIY